MRKSGLWKVSGLAGSVLEALMYEVVKEHCLGMIRLKRRHGERGESQVISQWCVVVGSHWEIGTVLEMRLEVDRVEMRLRLRWHLAITVLWAVETTTLRVSV
jgi:hypothetical protein